MVSPEIVWSAPLRLPVKAPVPSPTGLKPALLHMPLALLPAVWLASMSADRL